MTGMIQEITGRAGGRLRAALFFFCALLPLYGQEDYMLSGPLYGKNYYLPHLPVYSFPGFSPRSGQRGDRYLTAGYTGINEFVAYDEETTALDYESSVMEAGVSWRPQDRLLVGADLRLISYYGGFMDPLIESFHSIFDFPTELGSCSGRTDSSFSWTTGAGAISFLRNRHYLWVIRIFTASGLLGMIRNWPWPSPGR